MPKKIQVNARDFQTIMRVPTNTVGVFESILQELNAAEEKYPDWPTDPVYAAAIVGEESGELTRESLHFRFENGSMESLVKEAVQTAVTAIRFLKNIDSYNHFGQPKVVQLHWKKSGDDRMCEVMMDGICLYHYWEEICGDSRGFIVAKESGFDNAADFFDKYDRDCILYLKGWKIEQCIWAGPES